MSLWADFQNNTGRLIHKPKHYLPIYERHLARFVSQTVTLFEIGCGHGGSVAMWKRFLGPNARIVGIDIREECTAFEENQISIRIGSQADTRFLGKLVSEFGQPDIVIDDGSHQMSHIRATFDFLYPKTDQRGVYIVEDLNFAYNPNLGGGYREPRSFIEYGKELIDRLHARYTDEVAEDEFTRTTLSMHVYDSMIIFERGRHDPTVHLHRGRQPPK